MTAKTNDEKLRLAEKVELLAPAGDMERLKYAIMYGADAVYFGSEEFSLRAKAQNFNTNNIREALDFCHERGKKAYMTVNIYAHNDDISRLYEYIEELKKFDIDAFIVSDPGVISIFKKIYPEAELHLSTQANTTNYEAAKFWADLGIKRIVLVRELSLREISKIRSELPCCGVSSYLSSILS